MLSTAIQYDHLVAFVRLFKYLHRFTLTSRTSFIFAPSSLSLTLAFLSSNTTTLLLAHPFTMSGSKRLADTLSSVDTDNPIELHHEAQKRQKREIESFAQFLDTHIPSQLLPPRPSKYLASQANDRLLLAAEYGIDIKDIRIGMDFLPEWDGLCWDPTKEDLDMHIQTRLLDYEVSREVRFLRNQLIAAGNNRLKQAVELGLDVGDLFVNSDLLPSWGTPQEWHEAMTGVHPAEGTETEDSCTLSPASEYFSAMDSPSPEPVEDRDDDIYESTDDTSTTSYDTEDDPIDDVILLDNFVSPNPSYHESPRRDIENIFHGAEIVGAPAGYGDVDLEVYVLDGDDSDLDDMPELEMAVDRAGFEFYYDTAEAVDVEVPGVDVRCSLDVPGLQEEEVDVEMTTDEQHQEIVNIDALNMEYPGYDKPPVSDEEPLAMLTDSESHSEEE